MFCCTSALVCWFSLWRCWVCVVPACHYVCKFTAVYVFESFCVVFSLMYALWSDFSLIFMYQLYSFFNVNLSVNVVPFYTVTSWNVKIIYSTYWLSRNHLPRGLRIFFPVTLDRHNVYFLCISGIKAEVSTLNLCTRLCLGSLLFSQAHLLSDEDHMTC